jgi:molybdopterin converting factor small subunit
VSTVSEVVHVKVRAYASLKEYLPGSAVGESVEAVLPRGVTVDALLDTLGIPREQVKLCYVNSLYREMDHVLVEGDEVAIFPPVGGGSHATVIAPE